MNMRTLNILSGLAVLFTTLAFFHLLHYHFIQAENAFQSPLFLAGMDLLLFVGILIFYRRLLVLRRGRCLSSKSLMARKEIRWRSN